jgi:hypothetical protein
MRMMGMIGMMWMKPKPMLCGCWFEMLF